MNVSSEESEAPHDPLSQLLPRRTQFSQSPPQLINLPSDSAVVQWYNNLRDVEDIEETSLYDFVTYVDILYNTKNRPVVLFIMDNIPIDWNAFTDQSIDLDLFNSTRMGIYNNENPKEEANQVLIQGVLKSSPNAIRAALEEDAEDYNEAMKTAIITDNVDIVRELTKKITYLPESFTDFLEFAIENKALQSFLYLFPLADLSSEEISSLYDMSLNWGDRHIVQFLDENRRT